MKANSVVWGYLMGACEKYVNVKIGEWVAALARIGTLERYFMWFYQISMPAEVCGKWLRG